LIADAVSGAIKQINKIPGVEIANPQMPGILADELERKSAELGKKASDLFLGPSPSEKIDKFFADVKAKSDAAAKTIQPKMKNALLPPEVQGFFQGLGEKFGKITNSLPAAAQSAAKGLASLTSGQGGGGQTPALALARTGSAESYRNRVAFSKQKDTLKIAKDHLSESKKQTGFLSTMAKNLPSFSPASIFGG